MQWLIANGWYVLIDNHPMSQELTSHDARAFVDSWKWVWSKFACLPGFQEDMRGRLFVDVLNEPDSQGQGWQAKEGKAGESLVAVAVCRRRCCSVLLCLFLPSVRRARVRCVGRGWWRDAQTFTHRHPKKNDDRKGMTELYLGTMDALESMTPGHPVFFVEGGGQGNLLGLNWGNGFATNRTLIDELSHDWTTRISDPNPFFRALMTRPYLDRVVLSPHVYVRERESLTFFGFLSWELFLG